jgi:hypothetical protein
VKAPRKRLLHLDADLTLRQGAHTIEIKSDRETIRVSLSSFKAVPQGPFGLRELRRYARLASTHLDQDWRIDVAGQPLLSRQAGRWRVQNWAGLLKLGLRTLRK